MSVLEFFSDNKDGFISLGVFIAAFASLLGVWWSSGASHRSNVSQMRERWIELLRSEIAQLLSIMANRHKEAILKKDEARSRMEVDRLGEVQELYAKIRLRLNPDEKEHEELISAIKDLIGDSLKEVNYVDYEDKIIKLAKNIMRAEWKKAARGEI